MSTEGPFRLRDLSWPRAVSGGPTMSGTACAGPLLFIYTERALWAAEWCCAAYQPKPISSSFEHCAACGSKPAMGELVGHWRNGIGVAELEPIFRAALPQADPLSLVLWAAVLEEDFQAFDRMLDGRIPPLHLLLGDEAPTDSPGLRS